MKIYTLVGCEVCKRRGCIFFFLYPIRSQHWVVFGSTGISRVIDIGENISDIRHLRGERNAGEDGGKRGGGHH